MSSSKLKRLLLTVEADEHALAAVCYVGRMIRPEGTEVVVFNVHQRVPDTFLDLEMSSHDRTWEEQASAWEDSQNQRLKKFMAKAKQELIKAGFSREMVLLKQQVRRMGVARDIAAEAAQAYDAVVFSRKGASKIKDLFWGSVANKLIFNLKEIPLLVVGGTAVSNQVLAALDGSEWSARVVDFLGAMLQKNDCRLILFHAVRTLDPHEFGQTGFQTMREAESQWMKDHLKKVDAFMSEYKSQLAATGFGPERISAKVVTGVPSRAGAIIEEAEAKGCGTIVIGRRGYSAVKEHAMGRVSSKVLMLAREASVWLIS